MMIPLVITGCSASPEKIVTPSGNEGYSIKCGAHPDKCYTIAGGLCPKGYDVIDKSGNTFTMSTGNTYPIHSMIVECK